MTKGIIDRFEGEYAVVEIEGVMNNIKRSDIPTDAREGDVIISDKSQWKIDRQATDELKQRVQKLADELWK